MAKRVRKPKPGIHEGVAFEQYQAWPYVNNSSLGPALRSGAHYQHSLERDQLPPSREMIVGSMVHCLVLQPELFDPQYVVEPDFSDQVKWKYRNPKASDEYKGLAKAWLKAQTGKTVVSSVERETAEAAATAVVEAMPDHAAARFEVSVVADCPETRLRLKARLDVLTTDWILDLKTTRDGLDFSEQIERFGYHRQAAFYQDLLATRCGRLLPVWLLAVETSPPYLVRCVELDDAAIEEGRGEVMRALRRIATVQRTGQGEGYPRIARWRLPRQADVVDLTIHGADYTVR